MSEEIYYMVLIDNCGKNINTQVVMLKVTPESIFTQA
jgi:hypothetical protein